ncbi:MAG: type II toxin-antitoxin system RelE/ParE family toxin [bacterium]|nr:type II toxin-antitoxin system RelE/ParE family toxin [bacterium]
MPLKVVYTNDFLKAVKRLPTNTQNKLVKQIEILQQSPFNPILHTKALVGQLTGFYSFRITRDWRAVFYLLDEFTIKIVKVGHRKDIYK